MKTRKAAEGGLNVRAEQNSNVQGRVIGRTTPCEAPVLFRLPFLVYETGGQRSF